MSKRILIVDDSSMMRKMIAKVLLRQGHLIVGEAKNGDEAIDLYKQTSPELVTMDITMKVKDGITAAKEIFAFDTNAKIIFLSNLDEKKYKKDTEELGAVGFVNKHETDEILDLINSI